VATASTLVVVDNTPPVVRIDKFHAGRTAVVYATSADSSGIRRIELLVNGRVTQSYAGRGYRFTVPAGKHGRVTIRVRAYDNAGTVAVTAARTWDR
jgi:hypothetical protein